MSNLVSHAIMELKATGHDPDGDPDSVNTWMAKDVLALIRVFAEQEHSGFSASFARQMFNKLAAFEPLGPLTGADDEWNEVGPGVYQNRRCSHVFKQADRFNGQAYDINGKVFREPNGACFTNSESMVPVTFPYTPTTVYVDMPESE